MPVLYSHQKLNNRWILLIILTMGLWLGLTGPLAAESPTDAIIKEQASHLNTEPVEQYWDKLMKDYGGYFPESKPPTFMELLLGTKGISMKSIFKGLLRYV